MDIETIFYQREKVTVELFYVEVGSVNFKTNVTSNTIKSVVKEAIELPQQICKEYFKKMTDSKYEKGFVMHSLDEIKPNYYITFNEKRYNVKEVITLPQSYYLVLTAAMQGETL